MDNLNSPQMISKDVESYSYQMDLNNEGLSGLEEAFASFILNAKYE